MTAQGRSREGVLPREEVLDRKDEPEDPVHRREVVLKAEESVMEALDSVDPPTYLHRRIRPLAAHLRLICTLSLLILSSNSLRTSTSHTPCIRTRHPRSRICPRIPQATLHTIRTRILSTLSIRTRPRTLREATTRHLLSSTHISNISSIIRRTLPLTRNTLATISRRCITLSTTRSPTRVSTRTISLHRRSRIRTAMRSPRRTRTLSTRMTRARVRCPTRSPRS